MHYTCNPPRSRIQTCTFLCSSALIFFILELPLCALESLITSVVACKMVAKNSENEMTLKKRLPIYSGMLTRPCLFTSPQMPFALSGKNWKICHWMCTLWDHMSSYLWWLGLFGTFWLCISSAWKMRQMERWRHAFACRIIWKLVLRVSLSLFFCVVHIYRVNVPFNILQGCAGFTW